MSRHASTGSIKSRPSPLSSKSFQRYEPASTSPSTGRSRASTIQGPESRMSQPNGVTGAEDVFDKTVDEEEEPLSPDLGRAQSLPDRFDELPIELASLTDR